MASLITCSEWNWFLCFRARVESCKWDHFVMNLYKYHKYMYHPGKVCKFQLKVVDSQS